MKCLIIAEDQELAARTISQVDIYTAQNWYYFHEPLKDQVTRAEFDLARDMGVSFPLSQLRVVQYPGTTYCQWIGETKYGARVPFGKIFKVVPGVPEYEINREIARRLRKNG